MVSARCLVGDLLGLRTLVVCGCVWKGARVRTNTCMPLPFTPLPLLPHSPPNVTTHLHLCRTPHPSYAALVACGVGSGGSGGTGSTAPAASPEAIADARFLAEVTSLCTPSDTAVPKELIRLLQKGVYCFECREGQPLVRGWWRNIGDRVGGGFVIPYLGTLLLARIGFRRQASQHVVPAVHAPQEEAEEAQVQDCGTLFSRCHPLQAHVAESCLCARMRVGCSSARARLMFVCACVCMCESWL